MARDLLNVRDLRDNIARKKINLLVGNEPTTVTTSPVTLTDSDKVVLVDDDTVGGAVTINLPAAADSSGNIYEVKKLGTTGAVTIDGSGAETIDGSTTIQLTAQYESVTIYCNGSAWFIV